MHRTSVEIKKCDRQYVRYPVMEHKKIWNRIGGDILGLVFLRTSPIVMNRHKRVNIYGSRQEIDDESPGTHACMSTFN